MITLEFNLSINIFNSFCCPFVSFALSFPLLNAERLQPKLSEREPAEAWAKITLLFEYYGRFVNLGVGNGKNFVIILKMLPI